jgi:parvulin-like peptidyl-prolyl isomerase
MTFRPKPAVKRSHRPSWETEGRRHLYMNIGFGVAFLVGVLALVGAGVATYTADHFGQAAVVNGTKITRDDYRARLKVDTFRINQAEAQARDALQLGRLTDAEFQQLQTAYEKQRTALSTSILEELVDGTLQGQLAAAQGVTVSETQIDQRLTFEATHPEERHLFTISISPDVTTGTTVPTDAQKAAAKAKADKALADIKGGKTFEEIAKAVSSDSSATSGGDNGWVFATDTNHDKDLLTAVFALPQGGLTDVLLGADGTYRIGKVSEIAPQTVDAAWVQKITDAGVPVNAYRDAVRGDLLRQALTAKIVAQATGQPGVERQVSQIFISTANYTGTGDEVKVRHILYTPGDKAPTQGSPVPSNDPGWATAKAKAQATFDKLQALAGKPAELDALFTQIAKTDSMDTGSGATGGALPYLTQGQLDPGFATPIFKTGLKAGDLIGPVQSQFGWHVILFVDRRPPPETRMTGLQLQASAPGADFAALAKLNSDGPEASNGGDVGWVAKYQLDTAREAAIFAAPIGKVSDAFKGTDGLYLFLVRQELTRMPDANQLATINTNAYQNWYTAEKAKADIQRETALPTS